MPQVADLNRSHYEGEPNMLRDFIATELAHLVGLSSATGIFKPHEAEQLLGGVLAELQAGTLGAGHQVQVWADDRSGEALGWVYFSPSFKAEGIWDLWWIGVHPQTQNRGIGGSLLAYVEQKVSEAHGRILIIETSSTQPFDEVRRFYVKRGYLVCGRIPDFYGEGDDKVTFSKKIGAQSGAAHAATP